MKTSRNSVFSRNQVSEERMHRWQSVKKKSRGRETDTDSQVSEKILKSETRYNTTSRFRLSLWYLRYQWTYVMWLKWLWVWRRASAKDSERGESAKIGFKCQKRSRGREPWFLHLRGDLWSPPRIGRSSLLAHCVRACARSRVVIQNKKCGTKRGREVWVDASVHSLVRRCTHVNKNA